MKQVNLRLTDELADDLKRAAARRGSSVNALAADALRALVDPEFEGSEADRIRERLRRAGLLVEFTPAPGGGPDDEELAASRAAAGTGRSLSDLVSDDRGER